MSKKALLGAIVIGLIMGIYFSITMPKAIVGDFIAYWSASRLLVLGENPYDQETLSTMQQSTRPDRFTEQDTAISVWNPPWLMLLFVPFSLLPFNLAVSVWTVISIILTGVSIAIAWGMVVNPFHERGYPLLLIAGLLFSDTIVLIILGQITSLVLFGNLFAAYLIQKERDYLAGVVLILLLIKPHLTFLLLFTTFIWVIRTRRWKVLLGLVASVLSSLIIATLIYPGWISSYITLLIHMPYGNIDTSTFGSFVQARFDIKTFRFIGVLLLPLAFWFAGLLKKDRWLTTINLTTMLTLPFAPYGFGVDQVMLLPVIVEVTGWLMELSVKHWQKILVLLSPMVFSFVYMVIMPRNVPNHTLLWIPLAFLVVYAILWRLTHQ